MIFNWVKERAGETYCYPRVNIQILVKKTGVSRQRDWEYLIIENKICVGARYYISTMRQAKKLSKQHLLEYLEAKE